MVMKNRPSGHMDLRLSDGASDGRDGVSPSTVNNPIENGRVRFTRLPIVVESQDEIEFDTRVAIHAILDVCRTLEASKPLVVCLANASTATKARERLESRERESHEDTAYRD
jgi:hypothetical protein